MIKLNEAVIVEGKYDKINLENFIDAYIIPCGGFSVFKDKAKAQLIRSLAKNKGIIIMTDSDNAGMVIRSHLKGIVKEGNVINVYLPQIKGKEKRKEKHSAEGFLGVEGLNEEIIITALKNARVVGEKVSARTEKSVDKALLFELGLSGCADSNQKRKQFLNFMKLPVNMSANAMLDYFGRVMSEKEFREVYQNCLNQKDNN